MENIAHFMPKSTVKVQDSLRVNKTLILKNRFIDKD